MPLHYKSRRSVSRYPSAANLSNQSLYYSENSSENCRSKSLTRRHASHLKLNTNRQFLQRFEEVNLEMDRLSQCVSMEQQESQKIETDLKKFRRDSKIMIQSQKSILEKLMRQDTHWSLFRRNHAKRMVRLRNELHAKLGASARMDAELYRLERQSVAMKDIRASSVDIQRSDSTSDSEHVDLIVRLENLAREKQDLMFSYLISVSTPDAECILSRISAHASEMKACECSRRQLEKCSGLYREALQNLRTALSYLTAPEYKGTVSEFFTRCYPLAIEASRSIEAAGLVIQPESCRRYSKYAPELAHVRPPKFPQTVHDIARRSRAHHQKASSFDLEDLGKLKLAERVLFLIQRFVLEKLDTIDCWNQQITRDWNRAELSFRKLEAKLQQEMAVRAA